MRNAIPKSRGHTLLELLISASIIAILALGMIAGLSQSQTASTISRDYVEASARVEKALQVIAQLPADQLREYASQQAQPSFTLDDMKLNDPAIGRFEIKMVPQTNNSVVEIRAVAEFSGQSGRPAFRIELVTRKAVR